ncbi:methylesterase 17 isoform X1 [Ricinus communis]|uniref:methylesterase 17 isoform X1 n=1 Tax=Ricinus communis TaxID=3988 RepID=UPI00201AE207|nr:methylesterase 17 isoform X1 [Ricinus communis]
MGEAAEYMRDDEEAAAAAASKPHFVLVHGIGGGSWCWYKIRCLMENSGYKVSCIDLRGAGIDPADANSILSFDDYNKPLMDFMSSLPDNHQVILVGHSAGGLSVTQATHKFAKKIRVAVYVAATMLKFGYLTDQDIQDGVPDLSSFGDVYEVGYGLGSEQPPTSAIVKKQFQRLIIYQMSPQEALLIGHICMLPHRPLSFSFMGNKICYIYMLLYIRRYHFFPSRASLHLPALLKFSLRTCLFRQKKVQIIKFGSTALPSLVTMSLLYGYYVYDRIRPLLLCF